MLDNADWLTKLNYIEMLRDIGRHFSVNRMLTMDSVRLRLEREQEMSFIEFNYMICQAYDFVELARRTGCNLQMGGSDQWGNIVMGVDLGRRMGTHQLHALTTPLLQTASGAKMGKTAEGAVWLNEEQMSAYDFWQYWRNAEDADVGQAPQAVHDPADAGDRQAGGAEGRRDQRGQEGAGDRGHHPRPRPRQGRGRRQDRAGDLRAGRDWPRACRRWRSPQPSCRRASACSPPSSRRASSSPTARRGARSPAAACGSTTRALRDEAAKLTASDATGGVIKLSLGKKRHVLLKPV